MIRTAMRLHRPPTPEEVIELLDEYGERAAVKGGGTWLVPLMGRGEREVDHLIDLAGLGLEPVARGEDGFTIAPTATYEDLLADARLGEALPVLHRAVSGITGGAGLRNVATLLGSACYAHPFSDAPGLLVGLQARMLVHGSGGTRDVLAAEFFRGAFKTALGAGEFLLGAHVPVTGRDAGYVKVKTSGAGWPVATAFAWRDNGNAGVVVGAVQATPFEVDLTAVGLDEVAGTVAAAVTEPWGDVLADAAYRRRIAGPVARRAAEQLEGKHAA